MHGKKSKNLNVNWFLFSISIKVHEWYTSELTVHNNTTMIKKYDKKINKHGERIVLISLEDFEC